VFHSNDPERYSCPCCDLTMTPNGAYCWRCGWEPWQLFEWAWGKEKARERILRLIFMKENRFKSPSMYDMEIMKKRFPA